MPSMRRGEKKRKKKSVCTLLLGGVSLGRGTASRSFPSEEGVNFPLREERGEGRALIAFPTSNGPREEEGKLAPFH